MDPSRRLWPRSELRAGDADRRAVVDELQQHYVEGRLTSEELGERVDQALSARTFGELAPLLTDLPSTDHGMPPVQAPSPHPWQSPWPTPQIGAVTLLIGVLVLFWVIMLPGSGFHVGFFPWPLFIWGFFFFGRGRRNRRF